MTTPDNLKPTAMVTITTSEWAKTHRDFKTTILGQRYILRMAARGTGLVPVIVTKKERAQA
ncbi:hypothetical protein [Curvibacter gracilis]|uniref:hypothetical protein n=1 Tax=Curvibacter gracilis TaxID=230310 RepID=UPI000481676D|nr:hypothetical protein [Curvibacter gracilis]